MDPTNRLLRQVEHCRQTARKLAKIWPPKAFQSKWRRCQTLFYNPLSLEDKRTGFWKRKALSFYQEVLRDLGSEAFLLVVLAVPMSKVYENRIDKKQIPYLEEWLDKNRLPTRFNVLATQWVTDELKNTILTKSDLDVYLNEDSSVGPASGTSPPVIAPESPPVITPESPPVIAPATTDDPNGGVSNLKVGFIDLLHFLMRYKDTSPEVDMQCPWAGEPPFIDMDLAPPAGLKLKVIFSHELSAAFFSGFTKTPH